MFFKIAILSALTALSLSQTAKADVSGPAWNCELRSTDVSGVSVAVGLAVSYAHGTGIVHCISLVGPSQLDTPVRISLVGGGVGLGFEEIKSLNIRLIAAGVASPHDLYGRFKLEGNASLTVLQASGGVGAYAAINDVGVSAGVELDGFNAVGLEANAELQGIEISPM